MKKPLSLFLAFLMCFGVFAGTGVTAFAAGETMTTYMVDIPRASDPNKAGWGHPAFNFLGGWSTGAADHFSVHTQDSFTGKAIYCIEPGIGVESGDRYTGRGEDKLSRMVDEMTAMRKEVDQLHDRSIQARCTFLMNEAENKVHQVSSMVSTAKNNCLMGCKRI